VTRPAAVREARPPGLSEAHILAQTRLALSRLRTPDNKRACVCWRQAVGSFRHLYNDGTIKVGVEGMADIGGVLSDGRCLQVETKTATGRLREAQVAWREMTISMGGLYVLARSPEDACRAVLEALCKR